MMPQDSVVTVMLLVCQQKKEREKKTAPKSFLKKFEKLDPNYVMTSQGYFFVSITTSCLAFRTFEELLFLGEERWKRNGNSPF